MRFVLPSGNPRLKYAQALPELNAGIAMDAKQQNSYIGRGTVEMEMTNVDAAIADFTRAAQIAPSPIALYRLGQALEGKGQTQQAAKSYAAALQLAPAMAEARARLDVLLRAARVMERDGTNRQAIEKHGK